MPKADEAGGTEPLSHGAIHISISVLLSLHFCNFFWLKINSLAKALWQSVGKSPGPRQWRGTLRAALMPGVLPVGRTKGQQRGQPVLGAQQCRCSIALPAQRKA